MHDEMERQFVYRNNNLLPGDKSLLDYSILQLMQRSLAYKKGWLTRIWAARQRARRIAMQDDDIVVQSKEAERITKWMKLHKDRPKWTQRAKQHTISDTAMEEASSQNDKYTSDGDYLMECVDENMGQDMGKELPDHDDHQWTTQAKEPQRMDISNIFSCVKPMIGFEGPTINSNTSCTHIVSRNP
jgi:hypothetical protein